MCHTMTSRRWEGSLHVCLFSSEDAMLPATRKTCALCVTHECTHLSFSQSRHLHPISSNEMRTQVPLFAPITRGYTVFPQNWCPQPIARRVSLFSPSPRRRREAREEAAQAAAAAQQLGRNRRNRHPYSSRGPLIFTSPWVSSALSCSSSADWRKDGSSHYPSLITN